jgi:hypothetical protein
VINFLNAYEAQTQATDMTHTLTHQHRSTPNLMSVRAS